VDQCQALQIQEETNPPSDLVVQMLLLRGKKCCQPGDRSNFLKAGLIGIAADALALAQEEAVPRFGTTNYFIRPFSGSLSGFSAAPFSWVGDSP